MKAGSHGGGFFNDEEDRNPRALTYAERAELRANLEPVLRDIRGSGAIVPDILEEAHDDLGPDCVCAWIQSPGGGAGSQGIRVQVSLPASERLADLADQLQEWEVEELAAAGRPATWPECPQHPGTHPLAPRARGDQAAWCCPATGQAISIIGALPPRLVITGSSGWARRRSGTGAAEALPAVTAAEGIRLHPTRL